MLETKQRFHDIDWLRVIGMLLIFSFHNARFFNEEDWHVKNNQLSFGATVYVAVFPKYLFLASHSFIIIMLFYELVVRRINNLRFLFGMKG